MKYDFEVYTLHFYCFMHQISNWRHLFLKCFYQLLCKNSALCQTDFKDINQQQGRKSSPVAVLCDFCVGITHSLQVLETWAGTVYLQSMIMVRVSLSFASWNGGWPHTNMNRITPRLQMSEAKGIKQKHNRIHDQTVFNHYTHLYTV